MSLNLVPVPENEEPTENEIHPDLAKVILTKLCFSKIHREILVSQISCSLHRWFQSNNINKLLCGPRKGPNPIINIWVKSAQSVRNTIIIQ